MALLGEYSEGHSTGDSALLIAGSGDSREAELGLCQPTGSAHLRQRPDNQKVTSKTEPPRAGMPRTACEGRAPDRTTYGGGEPFRSKFPAGFLILAISILCSARAQEPSREHQLKAVFLYNFAQFTEWPTNAFAGTNDPIIIGVLGSNPFGAFLEKTVKGESIRGRPLVVEHYKSVEEIKRCHILYIGQSESRRLEQVVRKLKGKPMLTVSDIADAANDGVDIGFVTERNRIKLRVNLESIKAASLVVSSKLLRLAEIVKST